MFKLKICYDDLSVSSFQDIVDGRLSARFNASYPVTHAVQASLGGVDFDEILQFWFTSVELVLPPLALGFAFRHQLLFGILSLFEHLQNVALS